jgi:uncharacterized protein (TIGR03435 family)
MTMAQFAAAIGQTPQPRPKWYDEPHVVDRTGLAGRFDIDLHLFLPAVALMARFPAAAFALEPLGFSSFPTALREQLGLKLENQTVPGNVLVIDDVQKPAPN